MEINKKSKNIREKKLNPNHLDLAAIYNNLGILYKDKMKREKL